MATTYVPPAITHPEVVLTAAVRRQLQAGLGDQSGQLGCAAEHAVAAAGKLLRPQLMLEACRAVGGDPASVLPAAVGTELGHIASLVHDDVIDGDCIRRGRPAVHAAFGVPLAILTGDVLVFQMFASYAECWTHGIAAERVLHAIQILSQTCIDICRGQALEAELAGAIDTTEAVYFDMIRLKTAGVCRAAAEIGATLGGGTPRAVNALRGYGEALGMAFQIIDDVLEYTGQTRTLGKPPDSDLRNQRITLPLIYALNDDSESRAAVLRVLRQQTDGHAFLAEMLDHRGILARARQRAERFTLSAREHLQALPASDAREHLQFYVADLLDRDR